MSILINGENTKKIKLKRGEAKLLQFNYSEDISEATFNLVIQDGSKVTVIQKVNTDFDRSRISEDIIFVYLTSEDLLLPVSTYSVELRAIWNTENDIDLTETMLLKLSESLHYPEES